MVPLASSSRFPQAGEGWSPNPDADTLSLPEQIAKHIGSAIIAGEMEPGVRLHEVELATRFRVSRAPIREALRILERDGLVNLHARRGAQVTELTASELDNIFEPRIALNGLLARRVAEHADAAFAARFTEAVKVLERLAEQGDTDAYVQGVYRVHRLLVSGCDNPFLNRLVFVLTHQTARYTRLGLSMPARQKQSVRNWKRLAKAVAAADGAAAQDAAEQLGRDSRDTAMKLLKNDTTAPTPLQARTRSAA